jgi:hypothetical protein
MSEPLTDQPEIEQGAGSVPAAPKARPPGRPLVWGVSAAVICTFLALDFATPLALGPPNEWLAAILSGVCIGEMSLIAVWAALAPGNIVVRIPWSLLLGTAMWFALELGNRTEGDFPREAAISMGVILLGGMMAMQIPLWIAKKKFRWRLIHRAGRCPSPQEERQFQIKHMLLATFLLAVALSMARMALPPGHAAHLSRIWQICVPLGLAIVDSLLVTIPCLRGAFASSEVIIPLTFGGVAYCCVLAAIELGAISAAIYVFLGTPGFMGAEEFGVIFVLNLSQCATVFGTLLIYRAMGFRLLRRPRPLLAGFGQEGRGEGQGQRRKDKG